MGRRLRFIPEGGALVEITTRAVGARYLLKPSEELNESIVGVIARAQQAYGVPVHALVFMSNHYHMLVSVQDACQMARFMNYVNGKLAKEAGRFNDWRERLWGRRYQGVVVSSEEQEQVERLRYVLSHGCKEGLVAMPQEWPGVNSVQALVDGTPLKGLWFDRSRESNARTRGKAFHRLEFATVETLDFTPLPCYKHLSKTTYRSWIADLVTDIEVETAARHKLEETAPLGAAIATAISAHHRPTAPKKSWAPLFHAATKAARRELIEAYRWFVVAYWEAVEKLRAGDLSVVFPPGSFIPSLAMIDWRKARAPG